MFSGSFYFLFFLPLISGKSESNQELKKSNYNDIKLEFLIFLIVSKHS